MLKDSVKNLLTNKKDHSCVDIFCRQIFNKSTSRTDYYYKGYNIIDENTIEIKYSYGPFEYSDSFMIDMRKYYRDEILNSLL